MSLRNVQQNGGTARHAATARTIVRPVTRRAPTDWVRNPSWTAMPSVLSTDQKFVGLYAVYPNVTDNFVAVNASVSTTNYLVDWGDGAGAQVVASGVKAQVSLQFPNAAFNGSDAPCTLTDAGDLVTRTAHGYSNGMTVQFWRIASTTGLTEGRSYYVINATANTFQVSTTSGGSAVALTTDGTASLLEYKIATVTITPQTGNLTVVNLNTVYTGVGGYNGQWLDIALSMPNATGNGISISGTGSPNHRILERCNFVNIGGCTNMGYMFYQCSSLQSVPLFDSSLVTNFQYMFYSCPALQVVPALNTSAGTVFSFMFQNCYAVQTLPQFNTSAGTQMAGMFYGCTALQVAPYVNTANAQTLTSFYQGCTALVGVPLLNTAACTNFTSMFQGCTALKTVPMLNTSIATNVSSMFAACTALTTVPAIDTHLATNMSSMFSGCTSLVSIPLLNTSVCTNMSQMFYGCTSLVSIPAIDTHLVTNMSSMFANTPSLLGIPYLDTSACTNMSGMFSSYGGFSIPPIDTHLVTDMSQFANGCSRLCTLPMLNLSACTTLNFGFYNCPSLRSFPAWNLSSISSSSGFSNAFYGNSLGYFGCTGMAYSFSVSVQFSGAALDTVYGNLATTTGQTITVSSNYGTSTDTPSIATAKGWTVVGS